MVNHGGNNMRNLCRSWSLAVLALLAAARAAAGSLEQAGPAEFVRAMGLGYNLGNTLEACGDWIKGKAVNDYETAWGAPTTTREIIAGIKKAGFSSLRVPVAWSNLMGPNHTIHAPLMKRVQVVVDTALREGLIVVLNIHWDGGWWKQFEKDQKLPMQRYQRMWSQIAGHFKNYPITLVFESLNEEACFDGVWDQYKNTGSKGKAFGIANGINQAFVDLVRSSGGLNGRRHLLIAGYCTNIGWTTDPMYKMPKDPAGRSMVSVHYYEPPQFAILTKDESWGKMTRTWGTASELRKVEENIAKLKKYYVDRGVPVVIGEYGCPNKKHKDEGSIRKYLLTIADRAYKAGMCPMLWDIQGGHFDRKKLSFDDPLLAKGYLDLMAGPR